MLNILTRVSLFIARFKRNLVLDEIGRTNIELEEAIFDKDPGLQAAMAAHLAELLVEQHILFHKIEKLEALLH